MIYFIFNLLWTSIIVIKKKKPTKPPSLFSVFFLFQYYNFIFFSRLFFSSTRFYRISSNIFFFFFSFLHQFFCGKVSHCKTLQIKVNLFQSSLRTQFSDQECHFGYFISFSVFPCFPRANHVCNWRGCFIRFLWEAV